MLPANRKQFLVLTETRGKFTNYLLSTDFKTLSHITGDCTKIGKTHEILQIFDKTFRILKGKKYSHEDVPFIFKQTLCFKALQRVCQTSYWRTCE
jgi:hypothetical protein